MPSRTLTLFILLFWAGSSGWFFYSEFWPRIRGGQAPAFVIDLADEARRNSPAINWDIQRDGKSIGRLSTSINYRDADDSFDLIGAIYELDLGKASSVQVSHMTNSYRVTRDGKLLAVNAKASIQVFGGVEFKIELDGEVKGEIFQSKLKIESPVFNRELTLAPVQMTGRGSALNPLHPVDRIHGLIPGKAWRIALVDPIHDALASLVPGSNPEDSYLQARVLPDLEILHWGGQDQKCYVIEYKGEGVHARTLVRARDGMVLRQEAKFHDDNLVLQRTG